MRSIKDCRLRQHVVMGPQMLAYIQEPTYLAKVVKILYHNAVKVVGLHVHYHPLEYPWMQQ
jgi:hypothetical protein